MPTAPRQVIVNGKFLNADPSGVHRVAVELVKHCLRLIAETPELSSQIYMQLWIPKSAIERARTLGIPYKVVGPLDGKLWEHFTLPMKAGSRLVLNLCNVGALPKRRSITMIHDAQIHITPQSYTFLYRTWHRFQQAIIGRIHCRILTVSQYSRSQLVNYGIATDNRIGVILNGIDHNDSVDLDSKILDRLKLSQGRYVLALANTKVHKNIVVLLRAFSHPDLSGIPLVLFGPDSRSSFERQGLSIPLNVIFAGKVNDGQLRTLYRSALCLAFPSLTEGFGLPPLEAMSEGCPTLVAPKGALPEVCGDATIYVDPHDQAAWVANIVHLFKSADLREDLRVRGKKQASKFTWQTAAKTLLNELINA